MHSLIARANPETLRQKSEPVHLYTILSPQSNKPNQTGNDRYSETYSSDARGVRGHSRLVNDNGTFSRYLSHPVVGSAR